MIFSRKPKLHKRKQAKTQIELSLDAIEEYEKRKKVDARQRALDYFKEHIVPLKSVISLLLRHLKRFNGLDKKYTKDFFKEFKDTENKLGIEVPSRYGVEYIRLVVRDAHYNYFIRCESTSNEDDVYFDFSGHDNLSNASSTNEQADALIDLMKHLDGCYDMYLALEKYLNKILKSVGEVE